MNKRKYIYVYDTTFIHLLNLIKVLLESHIVPFNIKDKEYLPNLFDEVVTLKIREDEEVLHYFISHLGPSIVSTCYYLFLSNDEYKELLIYYFLLYGFTYKNKVYYMRNLKAITKALKVSKYVSREAHKLKGFLRFQELKNGVFYAEMEPENNILPLLSKHFRARLKNEFWIIKDVKRGILSIYDKKEYYVVSEEDFTLFTEDVSLEEEQIQTLWKSFYKAIGIKERKNNRCRMNFMPKKYWKYIIEVREDV